MNINRAKEILHNWARWMKQDSHKLGYPQKSILMASGGESSHDAFQDMLDSMDLNHVQAMDAIIDSLEPIQRQAIYARYLKDKKPFRYEYQLSLAMDNIMTLADKRIPY